jgi:hypothetical protein
VTAVVLIIVHLVAAAWFAWSVGTLLRLRRANAGLAEACAVLAGERDRMATAVIEATAALDRFAGRGGGVWRRQRARDAAREGLPAQIFGDAEGRN